jgi:hypothetical protein
MIPVLVLTHGELANELLERRSQDRPHLDDETDAITLPWDVDSDTATAELRQRLKARQRGPVCSC